MAYMARWVLGMLAATAVVGGAVAQAPNVEMIDSRPAKELKGHLLSRLVFSCDYGVYLVGDGDLPDRFGLLRAQLGEALGDRLAGRRIVVEHYSIYFNAQEAMRGDAVSVGMASQGFYTNGHWKAKGSGCAKEKMTGGWVSADELTGPNSPWIVDIVLRIDDQPYVGRAVFSPANKIPALGSMKKAIATPQVTEELRAVMTAANADLIKKISAGLPPA